MALGGNNKNKGDSKEELLLAELEELRKDYTSLKKRREKDISEATQKAKEQTAIELIDLVDDCDRALSMMYSTSDLGKLTDGVRQLRNHTINRFKNLGIRPFGRPGDKFDRHLHDAIATEEVPGPPGVLVSVHSLGWGSGEDKIIRPAMVTVSKTVATEPAVENLSKRILSVAGECFYGNPECQNNNCAECQLRLGGRN